MEKKRLARGAALALFTAAVLAGGPAWGFTFDRISDRATGSGGWRPSISNTGRWTVYDDGGMVYLYDRDTDANLQIAIGEQPSISANGLVIAFTSTAALVPLDTNSTDDVYVYDTRQPEGSRFSLVSIGHDGSPADSYSGAPALSADGRYVAFHSRATNLNALSSTTIQVYVRDLEQPVPVTATASVDGDGFPGWWMSHNPSISANGRWVTFTTRDALGSADGNDMNDVFLRDNVDGITARISVGMGGADGSEASGSAVISPDGRYVVFASLASNLVAGDTNGVTDVFRYDRTLGAMELLSFGVTGQPGTAGSGCGDGTYINTRCLSVSSHGRYVGFPSFDGNLSGESLLPHAQFYLRDTVGGTIRCLSKPWGTIDQPLGGEEDSFASDISGDGRWIVFDSLANLQGLQIGAADDDVYLVDQLPLTRDVKLGTPAQLSPANGARIADTTPLLDWGRVPNAKWYALTVRRNGPFGPVKFNGTMTATARTLTSLARGTTWVWRVRGCNLVECGAWSPWRSFLVN